MTHMLTSLAQGKVAILLEGGYNLESISHSMAMCVKALLGDPLPSPQTDSLNPAALTTIQRVVQHQRKYWSSLRFHIDLPDAEDVLRLSCPEDKEKEKEIPSSWEERLERLTLESGPAEVVPTKEQVGTTAAVALETSGNQAEGLDEASGGGTAEPRTLQEFLLLPENVQVRHSNSKFPKSLGLLMLPMILLGHE